MTSGFRQDALLDAPPATTRDTGGQEVANATMPAARILWRGDLHAAHSLAHVNRELCSALASYEDLAIDLLPSDSAPESGHGPGAELLSRLRPVPPSTPVSVEVRHAWPPDFAPVARGALVMIQPWEFGGIPDRWMPSLHDRVDDVWCPSSYVRDCYLRSGLQDEKVHVVPNGVDTERFCPEGEIYPLRNDRIFRFLFVGGAILRKGIDLLLDAYVGTFKPDDDVCLVVKPFGGETVYRGANLEDRLRELAERDDTPAIEVVEGELSDDEMAALYRACDVLVHPYRGEGFALPVAEAMASGLAVVTTGYGACLDFCDETDAYLLPARERPLKLPDELASSAGSWWAEPDPDALREMLRRVIDRPSEASERARLARERIVREFRWDHAARVAHERLVDLASAPHANRRVRKP